MSRTVAFQQGTAKLFINTGTFEGPVWTPLYWKSLGITPSETEEDITTSKDFDDDGNLWDNSMITSRKWVIELQSVRQEGTSTGTLDAGQSALQAKSMITGAAGQADMRIAPPEDPDGGWRFFANVKATPFSGGVKAASEFNASLPMAGPPSVYPGT